jgi:PhnB protein
LTLAGERGLFPAFLCVYVADADETCRRALKAGAETLEAPLDTPYGDRRATAIPTAMSSRSRTRAGR